MAAGQLSQDELDEIYAFAVDLGRKAGDLLMERVEQRIAGGDSPQTFEEKENAVDIVTQTDEDVEVFIHNAIQSKYPSHKFASPPLRPRPTQLTSPSRFLGEETYAKGQSRDYLIDEQPTWCIDPLDGTVNYTHIFPMFCVSIGFIVHHRPVIGVIYAPFQDQLFSACSGRGAWLNEKRQLPLIRNPIPPMPANAPSQCIFSCEWGKDRRDIPDGNMHRKIESFFNMAAEIGARDGKGGHGAWGEEDVAAGIAILLEAGGLVTTANPPEDPDTAPIGDVRLGSRLYLAIRPAGPSSTETGRESQERTVREVWRRVRHLSYSRPGA
ncbi:Protein qutG [Penicillium daleae]|uniref:Inositol-1-monophosphatase n=1 Tax=Penicillium daleae TaxID=63821 RepID=A0AAD6BUZ0_9EURO|nr:Protein qutG [Penicillium daleae]KAJ5432798.1 Protein qutG [Penicillium daleae]